MLLTTEDNYICTLPKDVQEIAQNELNETNKKRKKALADIRKWIKNQSHIRRTRLDSNFILRFLRMQKFDIQESCSILDKYLTMRGQYPAWFQNLDCRVSLTVRMIFSDEVLLCRTLLFLTWCQLDTSLCCRSETNTVGESSSPRPRPSTPLNTPSVT